MNLKHLVLSVGPRRLHPMVTLGAMAVETTSGDLPHRISDLGSMQALVTDLIGEE